MKTNEDHDQEVQPKSQPNLILTVDMVDQGQLIEEVPFEEMTRDVIIVRDLEVEVQLDAQIEAIPIKHKKM